MRKYYPCCGRYFLLHMHMRICSCFLSSIVLYTWDWFVGCHFIWLLNLYIMFYFVWVSHVHFSFFFVMFKCKLTWSLTCCALFLGSLEPSRFDLCGDTTSRIPKGSSLWLTAMIVTVWLRLGMSCIECWMRYCSTWIFVIKNLSFESLLIDTS